MGDVSASDTEPNCCNCAIERILLCGYRNALNFEEQVEVIKKGRPTPVFDLLGKTKAYYIDFPFIAGCSKSLKLFCWPCLLFSTEESIWTNGFHDLKHVNKAAKQHALSKTHLLSSMRLKLFKNPNPVLSTGKRVNIFIQKRNENIQNNRYIVKQLIDVTCFLIKQELSFNSSGNFKEIFSIFLENNSQLKQCVSTYGKSLEIPSNVQSDLIISINNVMIEFIKSEIDKSSYISIILDEKVDQYKRRKLITILRYIAAGGVVNERFLNCTEIINKTPRELTKHIFDILKEFRFNYKVIAIAVDASLLNTNDMKDLKELIKLKYSNIIFLPSYAHNLISIISNSVDCIKQCKLFFAMLSGIKDFFSKSIKHYMLGQEMKKNLPNVDASDWKCDQKVIKILIVHKNEIENILQLVISNGKKWDGEVVCCASGILNSLQSFDFQFLLHVFGVIFPMSDEVFQYINQEIAQITLCCTKINDFQQFLLSIRNNFNAIWEKVKCKQLNVCDRNLEQTEDINDASPPKKMCTVIFKKEMCSGCQKMAIVGKDMEKEIYKKLFLEIIDIILIVLTETFQDLNKLQFFELLNSNNFKNYVVFPEKLFHVLMETYKDRFYFILLRNELAVIYESEQFLRMNLENLYLFLQRSQLDDIFSEVYRVISFMLTIPLVNISHVKDLAVHRKIENYFLNEQAQEKTMFSALPSIEKELLCKLHKTSSFYDNVIDEFSKQNKWIELQFIKDD